MYLDKVENISKNVNDEIKTAKGSISKKEHFRMMRGLLFFDFVEPLKSKIAELEKHKEEL